MCRVQTRHVTCMTVPKNHSCIVHKLYVVKDSGSCLLGCARLSNCGPCCEQPTAFPLGHLCTVGVLAGTHRCALMPKVAPRPSANPLWLLECGLVHVSWSSKQAQGGFTALLLCAFRCPCLTTILDSGSLECENTYINYTTKVFLFTLLN